MAYVEQQERNGRKYYYVTKNFRIGIDRWKKIRGYCRDRKPSQAEFSKILADIDSEAKKKGWLKDKPAFKYLPEELAEVLEDVKQNYNQWYGKLDGVSRKKNEDDFLVRFTYNSNAIEGNRLSLRETSMILQEDIIPTGASTNDFNEAINGRDCMNLMRGYKGNLGKKFLLRVHRELVKNTSCRMVGKYRDSLVRISGSEWTPPQPSEVPKEVEKMLTWWRNNQNKLHPAELAGVIHNKIVRIHPFVDGNGRTARVIMNWILLKRRYPMFYIENREKIRYYKAIEAGDKGDDSEYVRYLTQTLIDQHTFKSEE